MKSNIFILSGLDYLINKGNLNLCMAHQVFVSPDGEDWKVKVVGNERASAVVDTKAEAVERAREIARNQHLELLVQNLDGTIGWRNSYGNDPRRSKG